MISIGVLGYGYWGPNLVRVFDSLDHTRVVAVADPCPARRTEARTRHPHLSATDDAQLLVTDPDIDAIVIATPAVTHAALAARALGAGKHVLVEKPLAMHAADAAGLVDLAECAGRVLMVDHTFVYTPAVRAVRNLVQRGVIGDVVCWQATRTSLARFQPDTGVLWDLAVHDLAVLDFVLRQPLRLTSADAIAMGGATAPDAATITARAGSCLVQIHVNWVAAQKTRRTTIVGTGGTIESDEGEPADKYGSTNAGSQSRPTRMREPSVSRTVPAGCGRRRSTRSSRSR